MRESQIFEALVFVYPVSAVVIAVALLFITAPYGRHNAQAQPSPIWRPQLGSRAGWLLMEVPAAVAPLLFFALPQSGSHRDEMSWIFLLLWQSHYAYRAFVFPFRRRGGVATMPLVIALMGMIFNFLNAYLNWRYLTFLAPPYGLSWLVDPRFICGALLFFVGLYINRQADRVLIQLRQPGETGYKIPYGGLYRYISCPNYFGEILEWSGWALCTFSMAGLGFALWTAANLVPRALAHHRDYRARFPNYPRERHAVLPFLL